MTVHNPKAENACQGQISLDWESASATKYEKMRTS